MHATPVIVFGATGSCRSTTRGPDEQHAPTARANAGFTSAAAIGYTARVSGRVVIDDLFPHVLDRIIEPGDDLTYAVLPEWTDHAGHHDGFAADAVAVDLVFSDGSRLSEHGALDQYGAALSARGQHDSCVLHPDQWNLVRVALDAVAGRRVSRIELEFAHDGSADEHRGWIDSLVIAARPARPRRPVEWARARQGSMSTERLSRGNTAPVVSLPHGFLGAAPVTRASEYGWTYSWHAHNRADNRPAIEAFATTFSPSPWMGERGAFQVMPLAPRAEPSLLAPGERALGFDHHAEQAHPHRYAVALDHGIHAELTATEHTALLRLRYPVGTREATLVFDQIGTAGAIVLPEPAADSPRGTVRGHSDDERPGRTDRHPSPRSFLHADIDAPVLAAGRADGERSAVRGWIRVALPQDASVTVRMAVSLISTEQAERNLIHDAAELPFDVVCERAAQAWDEWIGRIQVEGASDEHTAQLATALARVGRYPQRGHEPVRGVGSAYASVFDPGVGEQPDLTGREIVAGELSVNQGFWDVYRTTWPLHALLDADNAARLLDGFAEHYRRGGWTSRWSAPGPIDSMTGTSNDVVFAQAVAAGVPCRIGDAGAGLDLWAAFDSALKNATVIPPSSLVGRKGLAESPYRGWVDTETHESVGWTLDGSINDLATAVLADALLARIADDHPRTGELRAVSAYLRLRAGTHAHLYDTDARLYAARDAEGRRASERPGFDPAVWGEGYTETNAWGTALSAPHDGAGLVSLAGGAEAFIDVWQLLRATPETGAAAMRGSYPGVIHEMTEARNLRLGMLALSNQPAHHLPLMPVFAGRPDLAQDAMRTALERIFTGGEIGQGWPGDEDDGEMAAWWIFASLGLYPLVPAQAGYVITAPLFRHARVRLGAGTMLEIHAPAADRAHRYVRSVRIDGEPWASCFVPHDRLASGARLDIDLARTPQGWGSGSEAAPPSLTPAGQRPAVPEDLTATRSSARSSTGDASIVLDDSASSGWLGCSPGDWIEIALDAPVAPSMLTLSSADAGDVGWRLEQGTDAGWHAVASGIQHHRWDAQLSAAVLGSAPASRRWRVVLTAPVRLTQLELLTAVTV